jgi:hypothetical protein
MKPDNERDLAHEADMRALRREQLEADCGGEMADDFDDDGGDPYFDDECDYCQGTGTDKWCDDILPCPDCLGERY